MEVSAPVGSIANMELPGACAARGLTGFRMLDCAFGALAKMAPDRVCAASDGGNVGVSVGGYRADRTPFIYVDFTCGTWGGRPFFGRARRQLQPSRQHGGAIGGGLRARETRSRFSGTSSSPTRAAPAASGAAPPSIREYRMREEEAVVQVRSDRQAHRPYRLYGGRPGAPGEVVLNPGREARALPSKVTMTCRRGDVVRWVLPGGGGWGDPLERDPQRVLRDVRQRAREPRRGGSETMESSSIPRGGRSTKSRTERLREQRRAARGGHGAPVRVTWDDGGELSEVWTPCLRHLPWPAPRLSRCGAGASLHESTRARPWRKCSKYALRKARGTTTITTENRR